MPGQDIWSIDTSMEVPQEQAPAEATFQPDEPNMLHGLMGSENIDVFEIDVESFDQINALDDSMYMPWGEDADGDMLTDLDLNLWPYWP